MRSNLKTILALMLTVSAFGASHASAHSPKNPDMVNNVSKLASAAQLTMRGKVTSVDYRQSKTPGGKPGIPYTFVTYKVTKVMQGSAGRTLTLRFAGGADGQGGFVDVSGVPTFEVGDDDILFVKGNGSDGCPLVECEFGRFRVLDGVVHEAHGTPVVNVKNGKLTARGATPAAFETFSFPAPTFEALMKRPGMKAALKKTGMSAAQAKARYAAEAPKKVTVRVVDPLIVNGVSATTDDPKDKAMSADGFMSSIEAAVSVQPMRTLSAVASADLNGPLVSPVVREAAPKAAPKLPARTLADPAQPVTKN